MIITPNTLIALLVDRAINHAAIVAASVLVAILAFPVIALSQVPQTTGSISTKAPYIAGDSNLSSKLRAKHAPRDICPAPSTFEQEILNLINTERAAQGLDPVQMDKHLANAALVLAQDMHDNCFLSHTGSNGSLFSERILDAGYPSGSSMGEIAAAGYSTPQAVVTGWMNSSGHRANILNGSFTHAGVSHVGSSGTCRLTSHDITVSRQFSNVDFGGSADPAHTGCSADPLVPEPPQNLAVSQ